MGLPPRLALSVFAGPARSCVLGSRTAARKDWQAKSRRGFSDFYMQPLFDPELEESPFFAPKGRSEPTCYVACKKLAKNLVRNLLGYHNPSRQLLLECNPGERGRSFAHSLYIPGFLNQICLLCARVFSSKSNLARVTSLLMGLDD